MYRFVLRGRWLAGLLAVLAVAGVCVRLGIWQLDRRGERRDFNEVVAVRRSLPPLDAEEAFRPGAGRQVEFRAVEVTGRWDRGREVVLRAQSYEGSPGHHVLTPLRRGRDRAILVNRGFVPVTDPAAPVPEVAKPPAGEVTVVGTLRSPEGGGRYDPAGPEVRASGTLGHVNRVDVDRIEAALPYELHDLYVRTERERPAESGVPIALRPPPLGEGPHLAYAVQWFLFAGVFLTGWAVLVVRQGPQRRRLPRAASDARLASTTSARSGLDL